MWWRRNKLPLFACVGFQGALHPPIDWLGTLSASGVRWEGLDAAEDERWRARLIHDVWGTAELTAAREPASVPDPFIEFEQRLSPSEKSAAQKMGHLLFLKMEGDKGHVLRDRKDLLRFVQALLIDDGLVGTDLLSLLHWSPAQLDQELSHDAPLDIEQIHCLHLVEPEDGSGTGWLHSHGLGEIGAVDFVVLNPSPLLLSEQHDVLRSLAFAIMENPALGDAPIVLPPQPLRPVDAGEFMQTGRPADVALRESEGHDRNRVVICDPQGSGGLFSMFRKRDQPRPSRLLQQGTRPDRDLVNYSTAATDLMAERARGTMAVFDALRKELAWLEGPSLVKLGYVVDGESEADGGREHIWFEVHGLDDETIDATCINQPFNVSGLHEGQRGEHHHSLLSDWAIITPIGQVTPRTLGVAQKIREQEPEIRRALADVRAQS